MNKFIIFTVSFILTCLAMLILVNVCSIFEIFSITESFIVSSTGLIIGIIVICTKKILKAIEKQEKIKEL